MIAPWQAWQKAQVKGVLPSHACTSTGVTESTGERCLTFPCLHLNRCDRKYRWIVSYPPVPAPQQVWQKAQVKGVLPSRACTSTGVPSEGLMVKKVPTFFPFTMLMMAFSSQPLQITTDTPFFSAHVAAFTCHTNHLAYISPPFIHHLSTLFMLSAISSMSSNVVIQKQKPT